MVSARPLRSWRGAAALLLAALVLTLGAAPAARADTYHPTLSQPVTDLGGYLTPAERETVSANLVAYRQATGIQLAVLLVPTTGAEGIEDYAQAVFDLWGGGSKERNDGALFVLAVSDRRSRLQLGYGLEVYLSDGEALLLLDELRPALRDARYADATNQLIEGLWHATADVKPGESIAPSLPRTPWFLWLVLILAAGWGYWWRVRRPTVKSKAARRKARKAGEEVPDRASLDALATYRKLEATALFAAVPVHAAAWVAITRDRRLALTGMTAFSAALNSYWP